jgi:SnoaL-like domain
MKHYDRNCSADFELLENGEVWRRPEIEKYVNNVKSKPRTWERENTFDIINAYVKGNFAWVNYNNSATIINKSDDKKIEMKWLESIILEKIKGKWTLHQMHSTKVGK